MESSKNVRGISRVLTKLEASINSGNYYEAHQMYRTLYFRYLGQKKYSDALLLLYDGANTLIQHGQFGSGADLSILLIDVLVVSNTPTSEEWFEKIAKLFAAIGPTVPERETLLLNAIRWSSDNNKRGHPDLHKKIADIYWKEENYPMARHHFLHSSDGRNCAHMLIDLHRTRGYTSETDLFIAQAVLQYLCLNNSRAALDVFKEYTQVHPNLKTKCPPYNYPLLNFLWFLLEAVEKKNIKAYRVLCDKYQPSINKDTTYLKYLDKIGQVYFGMSPPRQRNNGLFGNLLQNLLNDLEVVSDEENEPPFQPRASTSSSYYDINSTNLD